ncbi:MAG: SdrD B-like domain-containing protein, partial [Gammaproteobacteria bacterium]
MLRMHKTAGTGSPRFFLIVALLGVALAALPGAVGANGDQLVRDAGIASTVWLDENRDGIRDKTESGLSDVNVSLLDCDGSFLAATRTDARGQYRFDVAQGCYRIRFGAHEGHRYCPAYLGNDTARDSDADPATGLTKALQVQSGGLLTDVDAGAVAVLGSELGDRIWEDMNANGVQDVGEPGLGGVPVVLLDCAGNELTTDAGQRRVATTDADGYFVFEKLPSSCYRMRVLADDAWRFSAQDAAVDALDSDVDPRSGVGEPVQLAAASGRFDMDAGLYRPASVGDWVWFDANVDGLQGKHENGVPGIQVLLLTADGVPTGLTAVTDGKGYFEFSGLKPDDYRVQYIVPAPYRIGKRNQGIDIQLDSDANSLGTTRVVSLRSGGAHVDVDLGLFGGGPVDIAIEKLTNGMDADEPTGPVVEAGADVLWEYIVTNTGDADLFEIAVVDDQGVSVTCPDDFLGSGESFTCTGSTDDAQAGQYVNMATVCGNDQTDEPQEVCSTDASHYFGSVPGIVIETLTNGADADTPTGPNVVVGDTVMWEYVVTNSGNIELTDVVVVDSEGVTVTCPSTTLAPGVSMTCTATGTSTAGQYMNVGSVTGTPPVGADVSATDPSHYFGSSPLLSIEKTTNGVDADVAPGPTIGVGEPVEWLYTVTNDGNVPLGGLNITDSQGVIVTCPSTTLPPGGSITCTGSGVAQDGPYMNLGTACAAAGDNPEVCASDPSHYTGAGPMIDIETLTQNVDADDPTGPNVIVGLPITWDYVITNTGGTPLSNIVVTDDQGVAINCPATTLEPGESFTCSASGTAEPGQYANVGSVTADGSGETVTDSDPSHYFGIFFEITLEKATNGFDADVPTGPAIPVGEPVTWTYVATNTGNVRLNTIDLFDNQGVDVACPAIDFLDPGESITCTGNGVAQSGQYANIGEVCAFFEEEEVCDTDPSHYFGPGGGLTIEKSTNGEDADTPTGPEITEDDPVNWTYVVTNTGNVTVNNIVVTDDQGVAVDCPTDTLAPGASLTCTGEGIATVGQYANIGSATGQPVDDNGDPVGDPIGDTDPSHYLGTPIPTASIGDRVFVDLDRDGTQNPEEPGLPGVTVNLWVDDDGD